ncbi:MAG: HAD family hydrolase [Chloroflexi bacterium]|nr:HAD family hydrolase [Chloroflexota bacterium]MBV9601155.1 HAD family hydrolase [Chloroflexota bacterium]
MDAVILDVGGVLLVPHFETVNPALEPFGAHLDLDGAERAHYFGARALDESLDERNAYITAYALAAGVPESRVNEAIEAIWQGWAQPNIEVWRQHVRGSLDGMWRLGKRGVKLGIISNSDGTVEEQLRRGEICQVGEGVGVPVLAIIDSGVVGVSKPAVEIFRHALEPIGVEPERALYVGDTVRYDVRGARAAGLVPVHFDRYELCPERDDHAHVTDLAEVEALL